MDLVLVVLHDRGPLSFFTFLVCWVFLPGGLDEMLCGAVVHLKQWRAIVWSICAVEIRLSVQLSLAVVWSCSGEHAWLLAVAVGS